MVSDVKDAGFRSTSDYSESCDYSDPGLKPPKKPERKLPQQRKKLAAKLNTSIRTGHTEQIYERTEQTQRSEAVSGSSLAGQEDCWAISQESYRVLQAQKLAYIAALDAVKKEDEIKMISAKNKDEIKMISVWNEDEMKKISVKKEDEIKKISVKKEDEIKKISGSREEDREQGTGTRKSDLGVRAMPVSLQNNLSELDTLLADLNSAKYNGDTGGDTAARSVVSTAYAYGDYYSDLDSCVGDQKPPERPPPPKTYNRPEPVRGEYSNYKPPSVTLSPPPSSGGGRSMRSGGSRRKPPKLMHILKEGKSHDLAREARDDDAMDMEVADDGTDYDYSVQHDYGSVSNYSTLRTATRDEYDYATLSRNHPVSEEELEKETGAGPRGERSMAIETDHGEVMSKYRYMGFGLWENTDPTAPKPIKKPSPPPPPPKAEPIMYACTVSVTKTISSKELDDLILGDSFNSMATRDVEVADGIADPGAGLGGFEYFDKEDMSDMFKRAMLEKMQLTEDPRAKYQCFVCTSLISGRIITAMGNKFHPQCFVCTYCRKEFKDRKYKTDPRDSQPYCFHCFEKLLGHYGDAHQG